VTLARRADPIVAVATAAGRGAIGIVRVSGQGLAPLLPRLVQRPPAPREATYGAFLDARGGVIDRGLVLWFPAPASATGEDVIELQAHGGPVLLELLVVRCIEAAQDAAQQDANEALGRLRPAEPGEFTQRAFLNGKLDLAQAEAVADLIDADTEAAARAAARSLEGAFSNAVNALAEGLAELRALVEATLDFPEEELDFLQQAGAAGRLAALAADLDTLRGEARAGALLSEGLAVVLAGAPNVGKSSLLNALAGREAAIVTPIPGTTRDRIELAVQLRGVPLRLTDTAGLREGWTDPVEGLGIERSREAIARADVVLLLHDLEALADPAGGEAAASADDAIAAAVATAGPARCLHVFNKCDAVAADAREALVAARTGAVVISARTGEGLAALEAALVGGALAQVGAEGAFAARTRHVQALDETATRLRAARALLAAPAPAFELLAEELRGAHGALSAITGAVGADDLLGQIFSRFCIGK
jgi:tRNA modification GTPase